MRFIHEYGRSLAKVCKDPPGRVEGQTMLLPRSDLYNLLPVQLFEVD
jgi:hypothetical protein